MAVMPLKERNETSDQVARRTRDGVESSRAASSGWDEKRGKRCSKLIIMMNEQAIGFKWECSSGTMEQAYYI
jgi:hypothetical protein